MNVFIYKLFDPRNNRARYVGRTDDLKRRLGQHCNPKYKGNRALFDWLSELRSLGKKPRMKVLEVVEEENWRAAEKEAIFRAKLHGADLLNRTTGGDGFTWGHGQPHRQETKKKLSRSISKWYREHPEEAKKAQEKQRKSRLSNPLEVRTKWAKLAGDALASKWNDPEWVKKHGHKTAKAIKARWSAPGAREKMSRRMKKSWKTNAGCLNLIENAKGNKFGTWKRSEKDKQRLRNLTLGRKATKAESERRSIARTKYWQENPATEATRSKMSLSHVGFKYPPRSEESKRRSSLALKRSWKRRKEERLRNLR